MFEPKIPISKDKIALFCKKNYISKMSLFGSVLTEQFKPTSDVDFLVEFQSDHIPTLFDIVDMEEELSSIVGYSADLKTAKGISHYFRDDVVAKAKKIYG